MPFTAPSINASSLTSEKQIMPRLKDRDRQRVTGLRVQIECTTTPALNVGVNDGFLAGVTRECD
ncbi:MAG: hypothetical protein KIT55_08500 [Nitrosomonas sp.]|nr:hypothetical protein [Nitrosomonas sp.]